MTQANTLTIDELIRELDAGRATVKFILKRFDQWLPFDRIDGEHRYSHETLARLMQIREWLDNGMLPSQIESRLSEGPGASSSKGSNLSDNTSTDSSSPGNAFPAEKDIRMSSDALGFIQELFTDIKHHQSRIAVAHEKRAEAEERKAAAIEKRAEAEEKKAAAMNNIASALQEMNRQRAADISSREMDTGEIVAQAARTLTMNEDAPFPETDTFDDILDDDGTDLDIEDLEAAFDAQETKEQSDQKQLPIELEDIVEEDDFPDNTLPEEVSDTDEFDIDDISLPLELLDPEGPDELQADNEPDTIDLDSPLDLPADPLDDLSALIDTVSETIPEAEDSQVDDLEDLLRDDPKLPELDDLFTGDEEERKTDLDDLSSLLDHPITEPETDIDDLSLLVDTQTAPTPSPSDLDDLSLLVDTPAPTAEAVDLDDLSLLVDTAPSTDNDMDDLSQLMEAPQAEVIPYDMDDLSQLVDAPKTEAVPNDMDDLSALVDSPRDEAPEPAQPSLKPDITPEQDLNAYKAAVMKIIIDLKSQGLTPRETTDRLNGDEVPTLSGKPKWAEKAISKIYGYIDSAK